MSDEFVEKKSVGKIVLIIFIVLVILGGIGYSGYYVYKNLFNPLKYLSNISSLIVKSADKHFIVFSDNKKEKKYNGNISYSTSNKDLSYLNHLNIDYDIISSLEKEEIQGNIKINEDSKNILDSNIYLIEDSLYLDSNDLYNKTLLIEKLENNIFKELKGTDSDLNIKDVEEAFVNYVNYLIEAISCGDMKSEMPAFLKIKYTYEINKDNLDKVQNKFDELIKNDKKINLLINSNKVDKSIFDVKFKPIKIEVTKSIGTGSIYELKIISDDIDFLMEKDKKNNNLYHIKDGNTTGTLELERDTWTLKIYENEMLTITAKLTLNDNTFKISLTQNENDISLGLKEESKNNINITFSIQSKNNYSIDLSGNIKKVKNGTDSNIKVDYKDNSVDFRMNVTCQEEYGDNLLTKKEITDSVDINSLSENEQNKIYENLGKKLEGTKLLEYLNNQNENSL